MNNRMDDSPERRVSISHWRKNPMSAVEFAMHRPGPVTERTVVVRFQRSPAGVGAGGGTGTAPTVGGWDVGAVGNSGKLLLQPATLWASTNARIPANVLIAPPSETSARSEPP